MPLLKNQAQQGNRVPSRLPNLDLSDIDPDPDKAEEILKAYEKNLPKYLEQGKDTLFTKDDEWQVPPVSTELRIFGSKKDNTTPQVVDAIKKVAGVASEPNEKLLTKYGTLPATESDRTNSNRFRQYQDVLGRALIEKYPEYKDALKDEMMNVDMMTLKKAGEIQEKMLSAGYADKYLTRDEQAEILGKMKDNGYSIEEWDEVQRDFFTKNIFQRYNPTNPKGQIEGGARWELGNFGVRYLMTVAGGKADDPSYLWEDMLK